MQRLVVPCLLLAACSAPQPSAPATAQTAPQPAVPPAAPPADGMLHSFSALGTEPFWHVQVTGDSLLFTTPEDMTGQRLSATRGAHADGIDLAGTHAGQAFALRVRNGACSDGMSDTDYPMTATFEIDGRLLQGCAHTPR